MARKDGIGLQPPGSSGSVEVKRRSRRSETRGKVEEHLSLELDGTLPAAYGETRIVLLPVDPYRVHVYWEVSGNGIDFVQALVEKGALRPQALLRFHDVTSLPQGDVRPEGRFDVKVNVEARNWYVNLLNPERSYVVGLGFQGRDGRFHEIARSNRADTPRAWPCGEAGEQSLRVVEVDGVVHAEPVEAPVAAREVDRIHEVRPLPAPTVPPARQSLHEERTVRSRAGGEPIRPMSAEVDVATPRKSHPLPVDASQELRVRLEAAYERRREFPPIGKGARFERAAARKPEGTARADLSTLCERLFVSGLPSSPPSTPGEKEDQDEG